MMKIGIGLGSHQRFGEDRYKKLKEHGFLVLILI